MRKLELELIDKVPNVGYVIKYCYSHSSINQHHEIITIPLYVYNWYKSAHIGDNNTFTIPTEFGSSMIINVTKLLSKYDSSHYMKIKFNNSVLCIHSIKFNKAARSYSFQGFVNFTIYDGNGQATCHGYKLLKNYSTRSKALYYVNKFSNGFSMFYNKWFIKDEITFNTIDKTFSLFHGDILYEHNYLFRTMDGNGIAVYTFMIMCIENG